MKLSRIIIRSVIVIAGMLFGGFSCLGDAYGDYIRQYAPMAVEEMEAYGIPASITLAQGLLESGAGRSTLAREANNHFGIKCHAGWEGEYVRRNDDAPDECFRAYESPAQSFRDHSLFLRRQRYASLFDLPLTDYASWARGLKKCGYATDPNYASRLIAIIELYSLYDFDSGDMKKAFETAGFIHAHLMSKHKISKSRGLHYVVARPGDTYASIASELKMKRSKLLEYNDVKKDREITPWQEVYLQPKLEEGPEGTMVATIGDGETMHSLAQRYGIKLESLRAMNPGKGDIPGTTLKLR